jgi:hypothetical protein
MKLVQTLLGAKETVGTTSTETSGGLIGTLLTGLTGTQQAPDTQNTPSERAGGDLFGSLLGGLTGAQASTDSGQPAGQIDIDQLLNAGMVFAQTKQSGRTTLVGIMNAVMASSRMAGSDHRTQVVSQLAAKKK